MTKSVSDQNRDDLIRVFRAQGITTSPTAKALDEYSQLISAAFKSGINEGFAISNSDWS